MTTTILTDGRKVQADECQDITFALYGPDDCPALGGHRQIRERATVFGPMFTGWYLMCRCCESSGEHAWSPSGHGVDPDGGHYGCEPCKGTGEFKVVMP